jgi:type II secretory pathway pseudopilin PulG
MKASRMGFTLFELILAIALSATLLAILGTAINLYLLRVDSSRTQVEEAQLARALLTMISDDIRAAAIYQPQDTSAIAKLMASGTPFDVDSIDQQSDGSPGGTSFAGSSAGAGGSSGFSTSGGSSSGSSAGSGQGADSEMPLGLTGTIADLYIDVSRLPRRDDLFGTITGYSNAPMAAPTGPVSSGASAAAGMATPASELTTVRYFVRPGGRIESGSIAATTLAPELQWQAGGLVRQEISRTARIFAEQSGNSAVLDSGQVLVAPEVVHLEFRYFDGEQLLDMWEMQEAEALPLAVEVRLWIAAATPGNVGQLTSYDRTELIAGARQYRQWVNLPMSLVTSSGDSSGTNNEQSDDDEDDEASGDSDEDGSQGRGTPGGDDD